MRKIILTAFALFITFSAGPRSLMAQEAQSFNRASQYFLGDRDELLIKVNILGYVAKPGQYLVPRSTDLISLVAFAGGPKEGANLTAVRIIRETIYNNSSNGRLTNGHSNAGNILQVDVKKFIETGQTNLIPPLMAGDTIVIPQSFGNKFKTVLGFSSIVGILAAGASIALIVDKL